MSSSSSEDESPIAQKASRRSKIEVSSSSSDSDEEVPLSKIASQRKLPESPSSDEEEEFEEDESDEEDDDDDDDDSEDSEDLPLSSLSPAVKKAKPSEKKAPKKPAAKPKPAAKTKSPKKKKNDKTTKAKKKKDTIVTVGGSSNYSCASAELYAKSEKGKLVQALLCRWWYAMTWPDPSALPSTFPKNTDSLDGFPGVYIYTKGESVGKVLDLRDKSTCPCFQNFAKKTASELQSLLLIAIQKQKEELILHDGTGTTIEKDLNALAKWASKVNTTKADKDALIVLKAANLTL